MLWRLPPPFTIVRTCAHVNVYNSSAYLEVRSVVKFIGAIREAAAHHVHVREQGGHPSSDSTVGEERKRGGGISEPQPQNRRPHGSEVAARVHDGRKVSVRLWIVEEPLGKRCRNTFRGAASGHLGKLGRRRCKQRSKGVRVNTVPRASNQNKNISSSCVGLKSAMKSSVHALQKASTCDL